MRITIFCRQSLLLILLLCTCSRLRAQTVFPQQAYTLNNVMGVTDLAVSPTRDMSLFDGILTAVPQANLDWHGDYEFRNVKGTVGLAIRNLSADAIPETFTCNVTLAVTYWTTSHTGSLPATSNITLTVNYDRRKGMSYKEKDIRLYNNAHYLYAYLVSVSNPAVQHLLEVELALDGERNIRREEVNLTQAPCIESTVYDDANDEWVVTFKESGLLDQADEFDLEWTYVDYYDQAMHTDLEDDLSTSGDECRYDFRNNATRMILGKNQRTVRIRNIFEKGFVLFRYRTVNYYTETIDGQETVLRLAGAWSTRADEGTFSTDPDLLDDECDCPGDPPSLAGSIAIINTHIAGKTALPHLSLMNWQYIAVFAEEAKSKETISYYDGTMRVRQALATNNSDHTVLVQENLYDFMGRPAIQVLPVPVKLEGGNTMTFYPDLNKADASTPYTVAHFDTDGGSSCETSAEPMYASAKSAAQYYSSSNPYMGIDPEQWDMNQFVPVAGGYPFTQTIYTRDNTGRIASLSGVGATHHLDAHKTVYRYETPGQEELTRLFGTDVGYAEHYKKSVVTDANGQVSVSYTDLKGKTIATALSAYPAGSNMVPLEDNDPAETEISVLNPSETRISNNAFVYQKKFVVVEEQPYRFYYSMSPQDYKPEACVPPNEAPCYDCRYTLEIKLIDQCGINMFDGDAGTPGVQLFRHELGGTPGTNNLDAICAAGASYHFGAGDDLSPDVNHYVQLELPPGEYTLVRSLRMDESDYQLAEDHYMANNTCKTLEDFIGEEEGKIDASACYITCETCSTEFANTNLATFLDEMEDDLGHELDAAETAEWTQYYQDAQRRCRELSCGEYNQCDAIRDILVADITPGGQYAAYRYEYSDVSKDMVLMVDNGIPPGPYTHNILDETFRGGLGAQYEYIDTDGDGEKESVDINALPAADFVRFWQPSWAEHYLQHHPEYCEYQQCVNNQAAYDVNLDIMNTMSYADAISKGFLDAGNKKLVNPILGLTGAAATEVGTGYFFYSQITVDQSGTPTEMDLSVEETVLMALFETEAMSGTILYNDFLTIKAGLTAKLESCDGAMKDLYWIQLRGLWLDLRNRALDNARATCPSSGNLDLIIERRFYNNSTTWPDIEPGPGKTQPDESDVAITTTDQCEAQCQGYRAVWEESLKGCNLDGGDMEELLDELETVCRNGCDLNNPLGARTVSPANMGNVTYRSFEEVMRSFTVGSPAEHIFDEKVCSDLLIAMPAPYGHDFLSTSSGYADTCECDGPEPPEDCPCAFTAPGAGLNNTQAKLVRGVAGEVENKCSHCVECSQTANIFYDFTTLYPMEFAESENYNRNRTQERLVTFFNHKLNLNLRLADYEDHLARCLGYDGVPDDGDVFLLYAKTYLATRTRSMKELGLVADNFEPVSPGQASYMYAAAEAHPYLVNYRKVKPVYAGLQEQLMYIEAVHWTPSILPLNSIYFQLDCLCPKVVEDSVRYLDLESDAYDDYISNPDGSTDNTYKTSVYNVCRTYLDMIERCIDRELRTAGINRADLEGSGQSLGSVEYTIKIDCHKEAQAVMFQYLMKNPLNMEFVSSGKATELGCTIYDSWGGVKPEGPTPADCNRLMPHFMTFYETYIAEDFEDGYIETMDLMTYLSEELNGTVFNDLVAEMNSRGANMDIGWTRSEKVKWLWEILKQCRQATCETFMTEATAYDDLNQGDLALLGKGLHDLAEEGSAHVLYTTFRDQLNSAMNKPPFLTFFNDEVVVRHFDGCAKGPCEVIVDKLDKLRSEYPAVVASLSTLQGLRQHEDGPEAIAYMLDEVNPELARAPYFRTMDAEELLAAIELCEDCHDGESPYDKSAIVNVLSDLLPSNASEEVPVPGVFGPFTNILPLFVQSGWTVGSNSASTDLNSAYFAGNPYAGYATYQVVNQALNNSFLHVEARPPSGNYFYMKMMTIKDNGTSSNPFDYMPSDPETGFAFVNIKGIVINHVAGFSPLEIRLTATATFKTGPSTTGTQDLLIVIPSYPFYQQYAAGQSCKHNNTLCNRPLFDISVTIDEDPCLTRLKLIARANAHNRYNSYVASLKEAFRNGYVSTCMDKAMLNEQLRMNYVQPEHHYTLYYYDQAGNLVKTVPPAGVQRLGNTDVALADAARINGTASPASHTKTTRYRYNTLNQLVEQETPDAGLSTFWYDAVGRLVMSQNAKQREAETDRYSYTFYDQQGRIREVGELAKNISVPTQQEIREVDFETWALGLGATRKEITRTYYDEVQPGYSSSAAVIAIDFRNLRGRVVHSAYYETGASTVPQSAVHYSYDIHGNVNLLIRETPGLAMMGQDLKHLNYYYDLVSGKVNRVVYQAGEADQYIHEYRYDAENRLVTARTGQYGLTLEEDANYYYYLHGPLARMEYGAHDVQGLDYTYTVQGWLKSVNAPSLDRIRDPGRDGYDNCLANKANARDAFGFELSYFAGDYTPARAFGSTEQPHTLTPVVPDFADLYAPNLYNGNIRYMSTGLKGYSPLLSAYRYDQLNRLAEANYFGDYNSATNAWDASGPMDAWFNYFEYDPDGNIKLQIRNGKPGNEDMDVLEYDYASGTNRLDHVSDGGDPSAYHDDIKDQAEGNYDYDEIGNLVKDAAEEIQEITWNVYGKISSIIRRPSSSKPDLVFSYTPDGHRAMKTVIPKNNLYQQSTYYVRDAQGNVMATYTRSTEKILNYDALDFEDVNDKLIELAGSSGFAEFIAQLHSNHVSSHSGFNNALAEAFEEHVDFETRLREMWPSSILDINEYRYRVLKQMDLSEVTTMLGDGGQLLEEYCNCGTDLQNPVELAMTRPATALAFFHALCDYDNANSTTYAQDILSNIYGSVSCPLGGSVPTDIQNDLDPMNASVHANFATFVSEINGQSIPCHIMREVFGYLEVNDPTGYVNLLQAIPNGRMLAVWRDFAGCGGSMNMPLVLQSSGRRQPFLEALHRYDAGLFASLVTEAGFSYTDPATGLSDLMTRNNTLLASDLASIGITTGTSDFEGIMQYLYVLDAATYETFMSATYATVTYDHECASNEPYSCIIGYLDANGLVLTAGLEDTWDYLLADGFNTAENYAGMMQDNDPYNYWKVVAGYHAEDIGEQQNTFTGMYGGTGTGMQAYFNYVQTLLGSTVYNNLVNHFKEVTEDYSDKLKVDDWNLYGSSRLGSQRGSLLLATLNYTGNYEDADLAYEAPLPIMLTEYNITRGTRSYELSNHLGNVLVVVSDKKVPQYGVEEANYTFTGTDEGFTGINSATVSNDGGTRMKAEGSVYLMGMQKSISTVSGQVYKVTFSADIGSTTALIGRAKNGATYIANSAAATANGTYSFQFTALGSSTTVTFEKVSNGGVSTYFYIDDVRIENRSTYTHYEAEVMQVTDYSPFGAPLPGRTYNAAEELNKALFATTDFTSGTDGWGTSDANTTITNSSGKLKLETTNTGTVQMVRWYNTVVGKRYRLSVDIDATTLEDAVLEVIGYNNTAFSSVVLNPGEVHYEVDFLANISVTIKIRFPSGSGTRTLYLDNVKLEEIKGELDGYRFGFNGQERDDEVAKGVYTAQFWEYDSRLGRRWNPDPIVKPWESRYAVLHNSPLFFIDPFGLDPVERLSFLERIGNFMKGEGYKNNANKHLVDNKIDDSRVKVEKGRITINESHYEQYSNPTEGSGSRLIEKYTVFGDPADNKDQGGGSSSLGDIGTGLGLAGEGVWLLGENRSTNLYQQGVRRGLNGNYQLTGRNFSLFRNQPMTSVTKPLTGLTNFGKGISNFGTGLAVTGAVVESYQYSQGRLSGARYGYHITGTGASIGAAYFLGGPYGAAVGGLFFLGEKAWDMTQPMRNEISRQYWQFENALRNGWIPR